MFENFFVITLIKYLDKPARIDAMDAVKAAFPLKGEKQKNNDLKRFKFSFFTGGFRCISPAVWSYLPSLWLWFFSALLYFAASGARIQREEERPLSGQRFIQRGGRAEQPPQSRGRRGFVFSLRAPWMQKHFKINKKKKWYPFIFDLIWLIRWNFDPRMSMNLIHLF